MTADLYDLNGGFGMLQADVDELTKLASTINDVASRIGTLTAGKTPAGRAAADALPGCPLTATVRQAGEFVDGAWYRVTNRLHHVGSVVTESASDYRTTDDQFRDRLTSLRFTASEDQ